MTIAHPIVLYQAVNAINGNRYIGITRKGFEKRVRRHYWAAHSGRGAVIGAAIRKYGDRNIVFSKLVVCPTYDYAKQMEVATIAAFSPEYNLTKGGDGVVGLKLTAEAKQKISENSKGNTHWLGKKHRDESKKKMSLSRLSGKGGPRKGMKYNLTDEERARRGKRLAEASRRRFTGTKLPPEQIERFCRAGNIAMSKQVICTETGETFPSLIGLSRLLKCDRRRLRAAVRSGVPFNGRLYQFAGAP